MKKLILVLLFPFYVFAFESNKVYDDCFMQKNPLRTGAVRSPMEFQAALQNIKANTLKALACATEHAPTVTEFRELKDTLASTPIKSSNTCPPGAWAYVPWYSKEIHFCTFQNQMEQEVGLMIHEMGHILQFKGTYAEWNRDFSAPETEAVKNDFKIASTRGHQLGLECAADHLTARTLQAIASPTLSRYSLGYFRQYPYACDQMVRTNYSKRR